MTSKEVKSLLKETRDLVKNKEYLAAIKKCKEVLSLDKKNGMAYVLLGAAYQETDKSEAAKCLRKAMEISPEHKLIALQGLANCTNSEELLSVLTELLELVPEKYSDYYAKLSNLVHIISDQIPLINIFCKEIKADNEERKYQALKCLLDIFMKNREIASEKYKEEFFECLEIGIKNRDHVYHIDIYQNYLKLLHEKGHLAQLTKTAEEMTSIYANNVIPLEWICKLYIDNQENEFKVNEHLTSNFGMYVEKLLEINPNSILGLTASAFAKYTIGDLAGSRDILTRVNKLQPNWSLCLKKLATIHERFRAYLLAELILKQLKENGLRLANALIEQQSEDKIMEGLEICKKYSSEKLAMELMIRGKIYLRKFEEAQELIESSANIDATLLKALLYRIQGNSEKALEILKDCDYHQAYLEVGRNYFELKNYDESLISILKATKLDANNSECFYLLGKIYIVTNDETRSKKCFEKCLNLNPQNEKAISILSKIYRKNKDWEKNLNILENSAKSVVGAHQKSAFFQLGLHHLGQQSYDNAITAFRNALKYDTNNAECWESLADAYLSRGSYMSALKVFEKSVELNPQNYYAKLQVARVKYILLQYQESIVDYEELLANIPDYLPALKGIAESHFGRAYYLKDNHRYGRSRDHCQEALLYLEKAIRVETTFICLWRLLGNLCDFVAELPDIYSHLSVPASIVCQENEKKLGGDELLDLASKCYRQCLKLNKSDEFVWFDMVANYYKRAMRNPDSPEAFKLAFDTARHLIKLSPAKWQNWNLLGIIATTKEINDPALAQHCFLKAITLDKKTFTSWSNLGVFYLLHGDIKLANKAFSRAQQLDPSFLNSWIGQASIAEIIGEKDEAMDLFRHCTQLGFHNESALGYSNFVASVLNEPNYSSIPKYNYAIDKMYAISIALDNIDWHCLLNSKASFEAYTYVGYLSINQKLYKHAINAYRRAIELSSGVCKDKCLSDLGFCYLKIGQHKEAIKAFSDVKEATFMSTIGLALSLYKEKRYQECYETYQKAIEWLASNDEEKALVLVAMAAMVYNFQSADDAKTVLFQCIGLSQPPVEGLLSLCAISLVHGDKQLAELTTKELKKHEKDETYGHHVAFMMAQFHIKFGSKADAVSYVISRIHEFPNRPCLRKLLTSILIETYKEEENMMLAACRMAESALALKISSKEAVNSREAAGILALASVAMESVDRNAAKLFAQKAVHISPLYWKILKIC